MQTHSFYRILLLIGFICTATIARAGDGGGVVARAILDGSKNQVHKDSSITVQDSAFFNAGAIGVDTGYSVQNVITLKINEASNVYLRTAFQVTVKLLISYSNGTDTASFIKDFTVTYDTGNVYNARNNFVFYGGRKVTVKVLSVDSNGATWNVSSVLQIENQLTAKPNYIFSCTNSVTNITISPSADPKADELPVTWTAIRGADQYDLEWTYVDESAINRYKTNGNPDPALIFYHNATRVSTTGNAYNIPLMYDNNGFLFIRVRPVQIGKANSVLAAVWSSDASLAGMGQYAFTGHERPLNWQANISFAEEGKRKVVVQYFDGSLRNRQTVTKDNTNNNTIVAETFYDYQGRPAVQVMPAPSLQNVIQYTAGFNKSINNPEYYISDYDSLTSPDLYCGAKAKPMDSTSGASLYYSPNNPKKTIGMNQFIPNAENYPFTETEYEQDNTGRIKRQGGVGPTHQLGSGHETKYFYSTPDQKELDALFGTDVGNNSHYFKNAVRDANGQYSVSYADMHGRTIATALAGSAPAGIASLPSNVKDSITESLADFNNRYLQNWSMISQKTLVVKDQGDYVFNYKLDPASLIEPGCDTSICYTCLYDLQITITDNCNNQLLPGNKAFDTVLHNFSLGSIIPSCTATPMNLSFTLNDLREGSYQVTKRLTISRDGFDWYRDSVYMPNNTCKSLQDFINEQRTIIANATQECVPDCATCRASVGTLEQYRNNFVAQAKIPQDEVGAYSTQIAIAYKNALAACNDLCGDSASADNDIRTAMLQDLMPPYGQYADTSVGRRGDIFNIFYINPKDTLNYVPVFKLDNISYLDAIGQPDKVYNAQMDMMLDPGSLSKSEFTQSFRASWAEALLPYHPEYCKLKVLESFKASNVWDRNMEAIDNFRDARDSGYLNPTGMPITIIPYPENEGNRDPFVSNSSYKSSLETKMSQYMQLKNGTVVNIWAMANIVAKCDSGNNACVRYYNNTHAHNFDTTWCDGDLDLAWQTFRNLYLAAKQELINGVVNATQCTPANKAYTKMPSYELLVDSGHVPHFNGEIQKVISREQLDYASNPDRVTEAKAEAQNKLNEMYEQNCTALEGQWRAQLAGCYNEAALNVIIPLLRGLCRKACDQDHLFGASTLPANTTYNGYTSFKHILETYNTANGIPNDLKCNGDLITMPAPYDKQHVIYDRPVTSKPADCECKLLGEHYRKYRAWRHVAKPGASFSDYIKETLGVTMSESDLQTLRNLCDNPDIPGEAGYACSFLNIPIYLKPGLQCNAGEVCSPCTVIDSLYLTYKQQYPNDTPKLAEVDDSLQVKRNNNFRNYMNNRLGYSLQTWEYLQFMKECRDSAASISNVVYCDDKHIGNLYQTTSSENGKLQDIQPTPDGGYIMAGSINSFSKEGTLVKTDSLGNVRWAMKYGGSGSDTLLRVRRTTDNGYIAIGTTHSGHYPSGAVWILKTNAALEVSWTKTIGFSTPFGEHGYDIIQTSDGGYAALGIYNQHAGHGEFLLSRLQSNGTISWVRRFGTSRLQNNSMVCLPELTDSLNYNGVPSYGLLEQDDTLLVSGAAYDPNLGDRYFGVVHHVNKTNGELMHSWHYADGADTSRSCWFRDIHATENGYMIMVNSAQKLGTVNAQVGVINVTRTGEVVSYKRFNIPAGSNRMVTSSVFPTNDGGYMVAQTGNNSAHIIWQRVDASGTLIWSGETNLPGTQTIGRLAQNNNGKFTLAGDNNQQMLMLVMNPGATCYDQDIELGATNETVSRIPWAINVDEEVSPLHTDITLTLLGYNLINSKLVCTGDGTCDNVYNGPRLCGKANPVLPPFTDNYTGNCTDSTFFAVSKATELYKAYTDSLTGAFERNYIDKCLQAYRYESFTVKHQEREYHYTLYYYDQAGNLLRTVPPAGVHKYDTVQVRQAREAGTELPSQHTLYTDYRYNTLNQVVAQHSPDGGSSNFWYDRLGRLSVSQNAKQKDSTQYSYTKYDILGRIIEVGQLASIKAMVDATSRNQDSLNTWLANAAGTAEQITKTSYDHGISTIQPAFSARNLRNRVVRTALFNTAADLALDFNATATYYSYDILGNVDTLLQDYRIGTMGNNTNRFKKISYDYDLVSGKVHQVSYQPGLPDAFYHRYVYDAEKRITHVLISADSINWDNDAFYQYYDHGPLARTVLGEQQVQGVNYAYNLQGWMKAINPNIYDSSGYTLKVDGSNGSIVGKPEYNVMLNYFNGDYKAISGATAMDAGVNSTLNTLGNGAYRPLYNGNISSMAVNIEKLNNPLLYNYQYDQLNRLVAMDAWKKTGADWSVLTSGSDFQERVSYDANGNILGYKRNGNTFGGKLLGMDSLTYKYVMGTNRLDHVNDTVPNGNYDIDIDGQADSNYRYDAIGNLIKDSAEKIASISWTVYGKISQIIKSEGTNISYTYDASGNRISKTVIKSASTDTAITWYVRDAQGDVMSVYESGKSSVNNGHLTQTELHLFGVSRLGLLRCSFDVAEEHNSADTSIPLLGTGLCLTFARGQKLFELSNHLDNVLVAINDKKLGVSTNNSTVDYFIPQVVSAQDYYPFGMLQPGRVFNTSGYRYGFNGKENDIEVKGDGAHLDYGFRIYDPRLGRFLSIDPLTKNYPWYTPYQFAGNNPIAFVDLDGGEPDWAMLKFIHWVEGQTRKEVVTKNTTNENALFGYGFMHGLATSVDAIGMGEDIIDIFRRANSNSQLELFNYCITGNCVAAQMILMAAGPEYGVAKIIDDKIDKAIHGNAYDRGELVAEVLVFLLPIAQEIKAARMGAPVSYNMKLATAIAQAGIPAEETDLAESFLLKALKMEDFEMGDVIPREYQKSWIAGKYKYEVRVHPGEAKHTDAKDVYRVSRQELKADGTAAGKGLQYLDIRGEWHPAKTLKAASKDGKHANPTYNAKAAIETHMEKPAKIE
jgi:RHS repeat-associated protein